MATASSNRYNALPLNTGFIYQDVEMFQQPIHQTPMTSETHFIQPEEPNLYPHHDNLAAGQHNGTDIGTVWETGFWKQFPWLAMAAMAGVLACTIIGVYILLASDGKSVEAWGYGVAPAVYLAVTSVCANLLLAFALANGLVITFWRTALNGCTLGELSRNWECGISVQNSLTKGWRKGGRLTALACLFVTMSVARGPIYQRATTIQPNVPYKTGGLMPVKVATKLPDGYTGLSLYTRVMTSHETSRLTPVFNSIMGNYSSRMDMKLDHPYCGASCSVTVRSFGFAKTCKQTDSTVSYSLTSGHGFQQQLFDTSVSLYRAGPVGEAPRGESRWSDTGISMNATYIFSSDATNSGKTATMNFRTHVCNLTAGTVDYDITLQDGIVTLLAEPREANFKKIDLVSPSGASPGPTTIGGFQYAMSYLFTSAATYRFSGAVSDLTLDGSLANDMFIDSNRTDVATFENRFNDPMDRMLEAIREIAFRAALRAAQDETNKTATAAEQDVPYSGYGFGSVYKTDRKLTIIASLLNVVSLGVVAATFYGWWNLGREVSMNPLEIAKAFAAPALNHVGSNMPVQKIAKTMNNVPIRYGEHASSGMQPILVFRHNSCTPTSGQAYSK